MSSPLKIFLISVLLCAASGSICLDLIIPDCNGTAFDIFTWRCISTVACDSSLSNCQTCVLNHVGICVKCSNGTYPSVDTGQCVACNSTDETLSQDGFCAKHINVSVQATRDNSSGDVNVSVNCSGGLAERIEIVAGPMNRTIDLNYSRIHQALSQSDSAFTKYDWLVFRRFYENSTNFSIPNADLRRAGEEYVVKAFCINRATYGNGTANWTQPSNGGKQWKITVSYKVNMSALERLKQAIAWAKVYNISQKYIVWDDLGNTVTNETNITANETGNETGNATGNETGNATGNETGNATGNETGNATVNETGNATGNETGNATGNETGNATGNETGNATGNETGNATGNESGNATGNETGNATGNETGNATGNETGNVTGNETGNATGNETGNATGNETGNVTGNETGNATGNETGNATGNETGNATGNETGNATGNETGNATGNETGNATGNESGNATGNATGNESSNATSNETVNNTGNETGNATGNETGNATNTSSNATRRVLQDLNFSSNLTSNVSSNETNATSNETSNATGNESGNATTNETGNATGNESGNETGNATGNETGNATGNETGNATGNETGNATSNETGNATQNFTDQEKYEIKMFSYVTYFDRQYDLLVDNLWSFISSSFNQSNLTSTKSSFLSFASKNESDIVQIVNEAINNTLPIFENTDASSVPATISATSIAYTLKLINTNGYIIIGLAQKSNVSLSEVSLDSLKNGTDTSGSNLLGFYRQYSYQGENYDFSFNNLNSGQEYNIYFAAGSDTFESEQLWTEIYKHTRSTGAMKLMIKLAGLMAWILLVFLLH